jgi:hypothetical protein
VVLQLAATNLGQNDACRLQLRVAQFDAVFLFVGVLVLFMVLLLLRSFPWCRRCCGDF